MKIDEHYRTLLSNSGQILEEVLSDPDTAEALTRSHNLLLDYDKLKSAITIRPEVNALNAAVKEYQFALFALTTGQYRHAFGGLRLFFELFLSVIQFSAHEIYYQMWSKDGKDINWNSLRDPQDGVFSRNFIRAFNAEFAEYNKQYSAIAEQVYRECSEFVHGNAGTHATLPADIIFNKEVFLSWSQKAESMHMAIIFVFAARYLNHIEADALRDIEGVLTDVIGHIPVVQAILDRKS